MDMLTNTGGTNGNPITDSSIQLRENPCLAWMALEGAQGTATERFGQGMTPLMTPSPSMVRLLIPTQAMPATFAPCVKGSGPGLASAFGVAYAVPGIARSSEHNERFAWKNAFL
jgi:hypothetical protein